MDITFTHLDGRSYSYLCRNASDAADKLMLDILPARKAELAGRGRKLANAKMVADAEGKWTETRILGNGTETRRMSLETTSTPMQAAMPVAPKMPAGLTSGQQAEWLYDQGANEGGEGYNPHRRGSARTYR